MKRFFLLLAGSTLFFTGCVSVEFESTLPINVEPQKEFPKEILGSYVNQENDTLIINKFSFNYGRKNYTPLSLK